MITAGTPAFIAVGNIGQDNSAITVTVRDLDMHELNSVAYILENASLILEDLNLNRIIAGSNCNAAAIFAESGANFTARRTEWDTIWNANELITSNPGDVTTFVAAGAIQGGGGVLNIEESRFKDVWQGGTVSWTGQQINIVSSRFEGAQGIFPQSGTQTNIVNSIWSDEVTGAPIDADRIANNSSGEMNIVASTILCPSVECDNLCLRDGQGWIYTQRDGAKINFKQSAVGVNFPDTLPSPSIELLDPGAGDGFTADEYTWIQPTALQDADALKTLTNQPNLLTNAPGLRIEGFFTLAEWATPLDPGELIDIVPDAVCDDNNQANDGANALRNPIDGTCITEDALGNPRVDANGARNSGAVQLALAPFLTVTGTGVQTVDLSWTKPQFSAPTTGITGYELRYRETGAATWTSVPPVVGPDNLSVQVGNLTSGTEYEFQVRATYEPPGEGPWSNTATGTPLGPIGAPVVTATPGFARVDLSWTKPSDGGHVIDSYLIQWRPVGTTGWTGATSTTGTDTNPPATQTTITGLTNGTEYEFAVTATATNGETGPQGTATATPFAPGYIVIEKKTSPKAEDTFFNFTQDIDNSGDFTVVGNQGTKVFYGVALGTYSVTENDPQGLGYELTNITCVDQNPNGVASTGDVDTRTATINVDSGELVRCTFFNAEEETVVIEKRTIPPGGSGFTFSDDIGTPNIFSLGDDEIRTFTHVPGGDYQVTEDEMPGYELTAIDCTVEGVSVPGDLDTRTASVNLTQPGGSAHCIFTNTKLGTIIMRKETLPDGAPDTFGYTINGPDYSDSGSLADGELTQVDNAQPGTWTLAESLPAADWHLGDISCTSALGTSGFDVDPDNLQTTVELAPGDTMDCTFTNVEDDTITVEKVTVPAGDTSTAFAFTGSGSIGTFALLDGEKQSFSVDAEAGPYILTEEDPSGSGYEVTEIECVNSQTGEITLGDPLTRTVALDTQPGESQHCTFTNELHGQVVIRKATAPAGDTTNEFGFYGSFGSFALKDGEEKTILDVAPGTYSVSEVDPTSLGYGLTGISCTDSDPGGTPSTSDLPTHTASINVDAGETVECTFINSKPDTVSVRKTTFPTGGTGFGFDGSFGQFTLNDGELKSFEVSSGNYTISEDDPAPGYDLILAFCYDASTGQFYEGDLEKRQVDLLIWKRTTRYCASSSMCSAARSSLKKRLAPARTTPSAATWAISAWTAARRRNSSSCRSGSTSSASRRPPATGSPA